MNDESCYRKLANHLDRLPGGFAPSDTGADLRLLRRLFTPQEAELATHLNLDLEAAHAIAAKAGIPLAETERWLHEMSEKGLLFSVQRPGRPTRYQAAPWVIGIYEFQVNRLNA